MLIEIPALAVVNPDANVALVHICICISTYCKTCLHGVHDYFAFSQDLCVNDYTKFPKCNSDDTICQPVPTGILVCTFVVI